MPPPTPTFAQNQTVLLTRYLGKATATNLMELFLRYLHFCRQPRKWKCFSSAHTLIHGSENIGFDFQVEKHCSTSSVSRNLLGKKSNQQSPGKPDKNPCGEHLTFKHTWKLWTAGDFYFWHERPLLLLSGKRPAHCQFRVFCSRSFFQPNFQGRPFPLQWAPPRETKRCQFLWILIALFISSSIWSHQAPTQINT